VPTAALRTSLSGTGRFPLLVEPGGALSLQQHAQQHGEQISQLLLEHGALLFRGFGVREAEFGEFVNSLARERLSYNYRSTPRREVAQQVFTATEYPAHQHIPFHCENAYQRDWPMMLAFCCIQPAAGGGETPLADVIRATRRLPVQLVDEFRSRRVRYSRFYRPGTDLPWQDVFQTADPAVVAAFCAAHAIELTWAGADELSTSQVCQATATHPQLGVEVWFNQAHLFHPSALGAEMAAMMLDLFGPDRLPRDARFGDGGQIDTRMLEIVRDAFQSESVSFQWQAGDVLLVDNMQVAHGRGPFTGKRRVLVAMSDSYSGLERRLRDVARDRPAEPAGG
jgi:alpha-ketoglutarate-dependent taurine dioxygenase